MWNVLFIFLNEIRQHEPNLFKEYLPYVLWWCFASLFSQKKYGKCINNSCLKLSILLFTFEQLYLHIYKCTYLQCLKISSFLNFKLWYYIFNILRQGFSTTLSCTNLFLKVLLESCIKNLVFFIYVHILILNILFNSREEIIS